MKPYFQVKFQDGTIFEVPTIIVANDRAKYYHERDESEFTTFDDALKDTIQWFSDTSDIEDWAKNNMNWDELALHARLIGYEPPDRNWGDSDLSFHDERTRISEPDDTGIFHLPMGLALARLGALNNVCSVLPFGESADAPPTGAVVLVQGGTQVVDYYTGGLSHLTHALKDLTSAQAAGETAH